MGRNSLYDSRNNFDAVDDNMFEASFEASFDDENNVHGTFGTEFHNEPLNDCDWNADRPYAQAQVISPSSLSSFHTPRKSIHNNAFGERQIRSHGSGTSPRISVDAIPFRDRFASAALVSQNQNARLNMPRSEPPKNIFHSQEAPIDQSFESAISDKSSGPISPNDESYLSFGNQSVYSDITESEMSTSVNSASRDLRRRARESKKPIGSPRRQMMKVHEEKNEEDDIIPERPSIQEIVGPENGKKMSKRLSSFFANRSISSSRSTDNQNEAKANDGDKNLVGRSISAPRDRPTSKQSQASPARSDNSESSSGYVGWPGTLDREGNTVEDNASNTSGEDVISPAQALSRRHVSFAEKMAEQREKESRARETGAVRSPARFKKITTNAEKDIPQKSVNPVFGSVQSRVAQLKRQFEGKNDAKEKENLDIQAPTTRSNSREIVDLDETPREKATPEPKPSDYHLAAALARVGASPVRTRLNVSLDEGVARNNTVEPDTENLNKSFPGSSGIHMGRVPSSISESYPSTDRGRNSGNIQFDTSASLRRVQSAGKRIAGMNRNRIDKYAFGSMSRSNQPGVVRLSEAALRQQERLSSSFQTVAHGANVKGYRGFINKTADVPNLMDDESVTSTSTTATNRRNDKTDDESDVFDGVSSDQSHYNDGEIIRERKGIARQREQSRSPQHISEAYSNRMNIVPIKKCISSIQTTPEAFENRRTSAEFDSNLTESDTDYAKSTNRHRKKPSPTSIIPGHYDDILNQTQLTEGFSDDSEEHTDIESQNSSDEYSEASYDLSKYSIDPSQLRKLVRVYRHLSQVSTDVSSNPLKEEEGKKAFALFEMRSRIMETDIERGFDRAGGTVTVDDIVLTPFYKASCRVRDAVIVSKAWRDGASPQDARTALNLTRSYEYFIRRSGRIVSSTDSLLSDNQESVDSSSSQFYISREKVEWIDDTEFALIRCFGWNTLRGFNIFTIGDCRSMLLKLTHEHCENLKQDLDDASSRQLVAEQLMKNEGNDSFAMTDAELEYLESMEDVKTIAQSLVKAEKAFDMVKAEIESQVQKLEHMLERIDNDSADISSYDSAAESYRDDESDTSGDSRYEREKMSRRVQRAELNAEVALKEAQIAKADAEKSKQEAEAIRFQKEKELKELQAKLDDLEAKSSIMLSDFEAKLKSQRILSGKLAVPNDDSFESVTSHQSLLYAASTVGTDPDQNEAKERIKAKFRQRRTEVAQKRGQEKTTTVQSTPVKQNLSGKVQQRLAFYERSLQAVGV